MQMLPLAAAPGRPIRIVWEDSKILRFSRMEYHQRQIPIEPVPYYFSVLPPSPEQMMQPMALGRDRLIRPVGMDNKVLLRVQRMASLHLSPCRLPLRRVSSVAFRDRLMMG